MTDIEHDRAVVEAMRRERGRLTRRELSRKYCVSERVLTRLITQYELAFKRDPAIPHYSAAYGRDLARRQ
jgi:hypothetical protein